jgi:hypothetical protein
VRGAATTGLMPVEPAGRGCDVEPPEARERRHLQPSAREPREALRRVPPRIHQHVGQSISHLPRASEDPQVIGSASTFPVRPNARFTANAKSDASDFIPRPSAPRSFASTMRCG